MDYISLSQPDMASHLTEGLNYLSPMDSTGISPTVILAIVAGYFILLLFLAWFTSRGSSTDDFFINRHKSPWYLVAFGMIGSSLSGVTFISIPGVVGAGGHNMAFSYMQVVLGYLLGYMTISLVLMPLYYRLNLRFHLWLPGKKIRTQCV